MQLYVSVDAATKDSLKAIDRPLFGDFWERFHVSNLLEVYGALYLEVTHCTYECLRLICLSDTVCRHYNLENIER